MSQAMYTAASGIANAQTQISVVSNNIANMNTIAFKQSAVNFSDVFYSTISNGSRSTLSNGGVNPKEVGYGAQVAGITSDFTTGTFQSTGSETDMMIGGVGYFTAQSSAGETLYTRAGKFSLDSEGYLTMPNGFKILGTSNVSGASVSQTPIRVPSIMNSTVSPTSSLKLGNKDLAALNGVEKISSGTFTINVETSSGTEAIEVELEDSDNTLGKIAAKVSSALSGATSATLTDGTDFTVGVNNSGQFYINVPDAGSDITGLSFTDGTSSFLKNTGLSGATADDDGNYLSKTLDWQMTGMPSNGNDNDIKYKSMSVDENGSIEVTFDNGDKLTVVPNSTTNAVDFQYTTAGVTIKGNDVNINPNVVSAANLQLQMATFINQEGLEQVGSNLYSVGANSGPAAYGIANNNGFAAIKRGGYESSNVDLTEQFSNMIIAQRAVEANSRVFDTANQIMKSLVYMGQ